MKIGIVLFPGSNCDHDTQHVFEQVLGQEVVMLWHKTTSLPDFSAEDLIVLPGGFSYGDYLRSGAIARFSPIMQAVIEFGKDGGKVLGICNGFQILCEAGMLPGALLHNAQRKFICKNVYLRPATLNSPLTADLLPTDILKIPIAHGEGRYYAPEGVLTEMKAHDQILFHYCDAAGNITAEANPNGSLENIAGVCNSTRNVFGLMPHPERAAEDALGNSDGAGILRSLISNTTLAQVHL